MTDFFERKKKELGIELNDVQKEAVLQTEGPLLLLACPGSGKTTTMIMRIGYLIEEHQVNPKRMKAITFSRASAADMAERFSTFFPNHPAVDFSTIHSLAFAIARSYLEKESISFDLLEGSGNGRQSITKSILLKKLYKEVLKEECTEDELSTISTYISALKNEMIPVDQWNRLKGPIDQAGKIAAKYEAYKTQQQGHIYLDFDDMLVYAEKAMREDEALAEKFRSKYDYVLTDESQDTSLVQHKIVEHLVAHHGNLCVVADDDQSIYTWRGADPTYLLEFRKVYPDAKILMMERNYRSSKEIVEMSAEFIKRNQKRYAKEMHTKNKAAEPILLKQLENPKGQLEYVIYELLAEKTLSDVAILFRNNASSTMYVSELHRRGIPFYMKDADDKFFSHWIVEDILNFMRLSFNMERKDIFAKIVMKMNLYVSRSMVTQFENSTKTGNVFDVMIETVTLQERQIKKLRDYKKGYGVMSEMRPMRVIQMIRDDLGYEAALKSRAEKFGYRFDYLRGILDTLEGIAAPMRTMVEFAKQLKELEQAVQTAKFNPPENALTLSTLHSSKGLEFRRVFMIDLQKGVIPSEDDEGDDDMLEEARRLFYVGMTRAKSRLELLSYRQDEGKHKEDSRFVNEVRSLILKPSERIEKKTPHTEKTKRPVVVSNPKGIQHASELTLNQQVVHHVFGRGEVVALDEQRVTIQFTEERKEFDIAIILKFGMLESAQS